MEREFVQPVVTMDARQSWRLVLKENEERWNQDW